MRALCQYCLHSMGDEALLIFLGQLSPQSLFAEPARRDCETVLAMPEMVEWTEAALAEEEEIDELDVEF